MGRHQETRLKLATNKSKSTETEHKVDSKLAKTNPNGQIECIICKVPVKSATLWKVHVNSKLHKERIMLVKQIKSNFQGGGTTDTGTKVSTIVNTKTKAMPKAAEKSKEVRPTTTATTLRDQMLSKTTVLVPSSGPTTLPTAIAAAANGNEKSTTTTSNNTDTLLPEKFFDDPVKDAKIRNTEYKDPQADEWERFQREIREASSVSVAIIAGEQIESAHDRDIEEINDQMIHWSRYMNLEARKGIMRENRDHKNEAQSSADENESDDDTLTTTEFSDWRSKAFI